MRTRFFARIAGLSLAGALAATIALGAPAPASAAPAGPDAIATVSQGPGRPGVRAMANRQLIRALVRTTAELSGQEIAVVRAALADGQSLAEFAEANGSSGDAVVEAVVAKARERLDQAVANGRISAEQAAEILTRLSERATELVNDVELGTRRADPRP
jgi:hypothetical protein